jgi:arylsulfatase A-like enzyme
VIVLDTVRADHLKSYGYERDTMPQLEDWAARNAVTIDRAISNAPDSLAAHASLFTGRFPPDHGAHRPLLIDPRPPRFGYPLRPDLPTLASILRAQGYATAGISANHGPVSHEIGLGLDRGFQYYSSAPEPTCEFVVRSGWRRASARVGDLLGEGAWLPPCRVRYRRADAITNAAVSLVDRLGDGSFLLFVNYMDAHGPYEPPPGFREIFDGYDQAFVAGTPVQAARRAVAEGSQELLPSLRRHMESQYDGELRFLDGQLQRLLRHLEAHPRWREMLIVIVSDHGEAFGEHRLLDHSSSLYDVMIRVPMIIKFGRQLLSGERLVDGRWMEPMQLTDVLPLVLRHVGIDESPELELAGDASGLRAWSFPSPAKLRISPRYARELRSIEIDGWKLIDSTDGSLELFHLLTDPAERTDLAATRPEIVRTLLERLGPRSAYRADHLPAGEELSDDDLERLRSLGYIR